jgi:hypothetical protein
MTWEDVLQKSNGYTMEEKETDSIIESCIQKLKQAEKEGKVCLIPELTAGEKRMIGTDVEICQSKACANCHIGCVRKSIFLKKRGR